jgi:L-threonylcarbamoyladenylate synthase
MAGPRVLTSSPAAFEEAARIIGSAGLVAFPTETYYGLAADPFSDKALARLFALKGRPSAKPVLTLIDSMAQLPRLTQDVPALFQPLMKEFWPGPLTLIFKARPDLSSFLTGGSSTIGIRISSHPLAQHLASCTGGVVTATSANHSGRPPAVSAGEVAAQFEHGLDLILDGGKTAGGKPSTVLALEAGRPVWLREGMVAADDIRRILAGHFPGQTL